jgi:3-carboxy-cis,cis-muconate cycloisomerase
MMRLTRLMGRHEAHKVLYEAAQRSQSEGVPFITTISEHSTFAKHGLPEDLAQALVASNYVGESAAITIETVERVTQPR